MPADDELRAAIQARQSADSEFADAQAIRDRERAKYEATEQQYLAEATTVGRQAIAALNAAGSPGQVTKQFRKKTLRNKGRYTGWELGSEMLLRSDGSIINGGSPYNRPVTELTLEDWVFGQLRQARNEDDYEQGNLYAKLFAGERGYDFEVLVANKYQTLANLKARVIKLFADLVVDNGVTL